MELKRTWWCKECNAFTVFDNIENDQSHCMICNSIADSYNFKDIDPAVIKEQRIKFINQRHEIEIINYKIMTINNRINYLINNSKTNNDEVIAIYNIEIDNLKSEYPSTIECDAGINMIEKITNHKITPYNKQDIDKFEHKAMFKDINRNDMCYCGSGKKYKHCCIKY